MTSVSKQSLSTTKIYFSASIRGAKPDPTLATQVVNFLKEKGVLVLSEHVAATHDMKISDEIFFQNSGIDKTILIEPELSQAIRKVDIKWVDEGTHFIGILTGPSLGVGMEIERALLKPRLNLNKTPILCLVDHEYLNQLSAMVRGINDNLFMLEEYNSFDDIKKIIFNFFKKYN